MYLCTTTRKRNFLVRTRFRMALSWVQQAATRPVVEQLYPPKVRYFEGSLVTSGSLIVGSLVVGSLYEIEQLFCTSQHWFLSIYIIAYRQVQIKGIVFFFLGGGGDLQKKFSHNSFSFPIFFSIFPHKTFNL